MYTCETHIRGAYVEEDEPPSKHAPSGPLSCQHILPLQDMNIVTHSLSIHTLCGLSKSMENVRLNAQCL